MTTKDKILALVTVLIMDFDEISPKLTAASRETEKVRLLNDFVERVKKLEAENETV